MGYAIIMSALVVFFLCWDSYQERKKHESDNQWRSKTKDQNKIEKKGGA